MSPRCEVARLGLVDYEKAWRLQETLAAEIASHFRPPTLLLLEHPHTYTFGRRGHPENMLWDEAERARRGVTALWVDRGGDVTYHGPGQLVGYPLLPLAPVRLQAPPEGKDSLTLPQADYVGYLRKLEATLILALSHLGVASEQVQGLTGVWVCPEHLLPYSRRSPAADPKPAKIAAIGVKVDVKGISRHGFALNVNPDMTYWDGIVGCGLKDYPITSLAQLLDPPLAMPQVIDAVTASFGEIFDYEMVEVSIEA